MSTSMGRPVGSDRLLHVWSDTNGGTLCNRNLGPDIGAFPDWSLADAKRMAAAFSHRRLCERCVKAAGWKGAGSDA